MQNTLHAIFSTLPFACCLLWSVLTAEAAGRRKIGALRVLTAFAVACTLLYFCHAVFFNGDEVPVVLALYRCANLAVYPLFWLYIRSLTEPGALHLSAWWVMIPAAVALVMLSVAYSLGASSAFADIPLRSIFVVEVIWSCIAGLRDGRLGSLIGLGGHVARFARCVVAVRIGSFSCSHVGYASGCCVLSGDHVLGLEGLGFSCLQGIDCPLVSGESILYDHLCHILCAVVQYGDLILDGLAVSEDLAVRRCVGDFLGHCHVCKGINDVVIGMCLFTLEGCLDCVGEASVENVSLGHSVCCVDRYGLACRYILKDYLAVCTAFKLYAVLLSDGDGLCVFIDVGD